MDTREMNPHESIAGDHGSGPSSAARAGTDNHDGTLQASIDAACEQACRAIAPAWPLDRSIAVNPHWGRIDRPVREVAARMAVLSSIRVFPSRDHVRRAWEEKRIHADDLAQAVATTPGAEAAGLTPRACIDALRASPRIPHLPLLIDVLDEDPGHHSRLSWREAITYQVSQTCAAYFDEFQAHWQPERGEGLFAFWRDTLVHDHGIGILMGLPELGRHLRALPATRQDAERWAMQRLDLPRAVWPDYLEAVLLTVNGWASWCAYRGWQANLEGRTDDHLRDLLAVRLAWGAILLDSTHDAAADQAFADLKEAWDHAPERLREAGERLRVDEVWQTALEAGYQRELAQRIATPTATAGPAADTPAAEVQAAFCIDVRSEPMRRALESTWPGIRTLGFAGFFGLPAAYTPLGTSMKRPQLPGLLAPDIRIEEHMLAPGDDAGKDREDADRHARQARSKRFGWTDQWQANSRWPNASFSFVEVAGIGYLGKLAHWLLPSTDARHNDDQAGLPARYRAHCRPSLAGLDVAARTDLAARVLHGMGLDHDLAPLVLLMGHGSQSANNAHAAALDCGACCGQTGEVNARALARMLNDPTVREGLQAQGIEIPGETVFLACLHNTTTDEIEGFDLDLLPAAARDRWNRLQAVLDQACDQVRRERAAQLGMDPRSGHRYLLRQFRRRANDGAQTRPEWGLAGNAAFVIAPRSRTRGAVLDGRCFLHDYDATRDPDGNLLESLMTAPMLVAHWINWQYHASTSDPDRMGSGNKVLHNVVGGRIGVFEGNGGDLRIGLSRQSLHDGTRWVHEPLRLTVAIDAPARAIEQVIARHRVVRDLVEHGWLYLWRFDHDRLVRYARGNWHTLDRSASVSTS
jgi:uncharacterized protein